jgi:hypothetical protein
MNDDTRVKKGTVNCPFDADEAKEKEGLVHVTSKGEFE